MTNIAGYQGYLEFDLLTGKASLVRDGLKLDAAKNKGSLVIRMRGNGEATVVVSADGKNLGVAKVAAGAGYAEYRLPLSKDAWKGTINVLKMDFAGAEGTTVAIDWMRVVE